MYEKETRSEAKHLIIDRNLIALDNALEKLENFVEEILGHCTAEEATQEEAKSICLYEFLNSTNDKIMEYTERIHRINNSLRESLF